MDILFRRNAVLEALRGSRRRLHRLWLQEGLGAREARPFLAAARERGLAVQHAPKQKLTQLASDSSHQGVVLEAGPYPYSEVAEILALAAEREEKPFLLLLDLLHGPQNIGALLRTAELCGVHGVIIQDRRAPDITPTVVTHSAGAVEHLLVAQVTNLVETMRALKEQEIWLVGMDVGEEAVTLGAIDLEMPLGIVVGHEGEGLRRLVRDTCDFLLRLPMRGRVDSFNAAVAGSILLFEAWQARGFQGANR
ncbi:MAG: 23S rRNA (guanosine(2251)-2'-O)-methyltransferase RlmB [Chloroflexi bacterium]|jgi:23S rRNA (guanosine2251-2'-O)-methyltransferase|nr:23S rRNA (guanosine(2251)-2'-O)-methyltransferase RlmB [Chloroflexota bacterium]